MASKKRVRRKVSSVKKKSSNPKISPSKKKTNPRITASAKKPTKKKDPKRVKAGKKGWKSQVKKRKEASVAAVRKRAEDLLDKRVLAMSREELLKELETTRRKLSVTKELHDIYVMTTEQWVPYYDLEQLHLGRRGHQSYPRGSIALVPSRARTLPPSKLEGIMRRMRRAYKISEDQLDHVVHEVSQETDYSIKEIYTLWFSP